MVVTTVSPTPNLQVLRSPDEDVVARLPRGLLRNQQVSGSSPLAGSNKINNLQGFTG